MMRKKVIMKKIDGQKTRERRPQIIAKRHQLLEKLARETIQDMKKKGVKVPYENVMLSVEGGEMGFKKTETQVSFKMLGGQEQTIHTKGGKRFSEIKIPVPIWTEVLSKKDLRKKYWDGLKAVLAHELTHSKKGIKGKHKINKKINQALTKMKDIAFELDKIEGITARKIPGSGLEITGERSLPKETLKYIQSKVNEINKIREETENLSPKPSQSKKEEKEAERVVKKVYGERGIRDTIRLNKYAMNEYMKKLAFVIPYGVPVSSIMPKKEIYQQRAFSHAIISTIEASRVFSTKRSGLKKLDKTLTKKGGIIDSLINAEQQDIKQGINEKAAKENILGLKKLKTDEKLRKQFINLWYKGISSKNLPQEAGMKQVAPLVNSETTKFTPRGTKWLKRYAFGMSAALGVMGIKNKLLYTTTLSGLTALAALSIGGVQRRIKRKMKLKLEELKEDLEELK